MNQFLLKFFLLIFTGSMSQSMSAQCADNLSSNGSFDTGLSGWGSWHDNNPDAYAFGLDTIAYGGDSSAYIDVLINSADLTSFQGAEYNNRPDSMSVSAGVNYVVTFSARSSVPSATISAWIKDEFDGWATITNESFDIDTTWGVYSMAFTPEVDRADVHLELKVYTEGQADPYRVWFDEVFVCDNTPKTETCESNLVSNPGFEGFPQATAEWWTWHGGTEEAYAFYASGDAYVGDSSAVLDVLVNSSEISTGPAEYNNRGMVIPVKGGEFYEVSLAAKSSKDSTEIQVWVKDEFDSWFTLSNTSFMISDEWGVYSFLFQADMDREDLHLELKVFNADFEPYQVLFDEVAMCIANPSTTTCDDNLVANPGAESGLTDWWSWHGGDETDYEFGLSDDAAVADSSLRISVLKPSAEITGTGEFNSRPQISPVVAGQNYRVSVMAKSTLEGAGIQLWVKDEFDGWTTIGNNDFTVTTEWDEYTFVLGNDTDRDDVHIEIKVFTEGATEAYDVLFDEISICATDDEPGVEEETPEIFVFGSTDTLVSCNANLLAELSETDIAEDGMGWETWDGSDSTIVVWVLDPVLPYSGASAFRLDVPENHQVADLHNRFADRIDLLEDGEYTLTVWARADVPEGDTIQVYSRAIRDTDWKEPGHANFMVVDNEWKNYEYTFTLGEEYSNAFIELKCQRWNEDFTGAYTIWFDDIQICPTSDVVVDVPSSLESIEALGVDITASPNPVLRSQNLRLETTSDTNIGEVTVMVNDMLGKNVFADKANIFNGKGVIEIETSNLTSGLYIATILHKDHRKTIKFQVIE